MLPFGDFMVSIARLMETNMWYVVVWFQDGVSDPPLTAHNRFSGRTSNLPGH